MALMPASPARDPAHDEAETAGIWIFPREEFPLWRRAVGSGAADDYDAYLDSVERLEKSFRRAGLRVARVRLTMAQMRAEFLRRGRTWLDGPGELDEAGCHQVAWDLAVEAAREAAQDSLGLHPLAPPSPNGHPADQSSPAA
jgi:hypothetical protein